MAVRPSSATTNGVQVTVASTYVPERSSPAQNYYFFAYRVHIENVGEEVVQLVTRHWIITDADGAIHVLQYEMVPAPSGWQINGVRILRAPDVGA